MKFIEAIANHPKPLLIALELLLVVLVGFADYITGPEISVSILYLLPIGTTVWFVGKWTGIGVSIISGITWYIADVFWSPTYSHPLVPYWNAAVMVSIFIVFNYTLEALKIAWVNEKRLARIDYLTGIANSRYFHELANIEMERARRYKFAFSLTFIDADNFKMVNDRYGHSAGNEVLQLIAATMISNLRIVDVIGRLGGDEFGVLLPNTGYEESQITINRLQKILLEAMQKNKWPVTFSIGMVTCTNIDTSSTVDEIIKTADNLMYWAKNNGKNLIKHELMKSTTLPPGLT